MTSEESAEVKRLKRKVAELREHAGDREGGGLRWGVEPICTVLNEHELPVAPSTYYAHVNSQPSAREHRNALLLNEIRRVQASNYGVFGAEGVADAAPGRSAGGPLHGRAADAPGGLPGAVRGKGKRTTIADPAAERARDLVGRDFNPTARTGCGSRTSPTCRAGAGGCTSRSSSTRSHVGSWAGAPARR